MADLTLAELREHVETGLVDGALQRLLTDTQAEVVGRFGSDAAVTAVLQGGGRRLRLQRPAATITSITEYSDPAVALVAADYRLWPGGRLLDRLVGTGWGYWGQPVTVVYAPIPEEAMRNRMVTELVRLAVQHTGLESERVGDYTATSADYFKERERVLQSGAAHRGLHFA